MQGSADEIQLKLMIWFVSINGFFYAIVVPVWFYWSFVVWAKFDPS